MSLLWSGWIADRSVKSARNLLQPASSVGGRLAGPRGWGPADRSAVPM